MKKILFLIFLIVSFNAQIFSYNLNFNPLVKYGSIALLIFTAPTTMLLGYNAYEAFRKKEYLKATGYSLGALYGIGLSVVAIIGLKEYEK